MASAGPSSSAQDPSGSVDAPRGDSSSNTQSPVTSCPGSKAAPRNPIPPSPSPAPPAQTQTDEVTSGPSGLGAVLPTSPQPQKTQPPDYLPSDERRNRLFEEDENAHPGWAKYTHLDGGTYYRHLSGRLLTPDDVTQPRIRECLERLLSLTFSTLEEQDILADLPNDVEIVAERMDPEVPEVFYFVSQSLKQVLNYAYDCPCPNPTHRRQECPSPKLRLDKTPRTRFWKHLASYPMHITALPPHSEAEFLKALTHGANERILDERKSMFPYTDQQAQRFMQVYRDLKCVPYYGQGRHSVLPAVAWHISRVMIKIEAVRELYRHGTKEARLYRDVAVETPTWRAGRLLDVLLFCVFFNSHRTYRARLESTRPKGHVYLPDFRDLMSSLLVEWSDSNLLATVFVSANVTFLAVPNITALPQTASLCSALFSMLSIVVGVHHVWRHRRRADADDEEASRYLGLSSHGLRGRLTLLSCFLALPLAALLWAILSFTIAVGAFSFTSVAGGDVHTRALLAGVFGVLLIFAVLTLLVFWDAWRSPPTSEPEDDHARIGAGRKPERQGWIRHMRRRMRVARADAMDSIQVRMKKTRMVVGKALNNGRRTGQTTPQGSDVRSTKGGSGVATDTLDHEVDV